MPTSKSCSMCLEVKSLDCFYKQTTGKMGRNARCKPCHIAQVTEYRNSNPDKVDKWRRNHQIRSYGLTETDYQDLLETQSGLCAICKQPETATDSRYGKLRDLCIDHDHETGSPRGLLCSQCNVALGNFKDSVDTLRSALDYLQEWKCQRPAV